MDITFGKLKLQDGVWFIDARPHVLIRLKRMFERSVKTAGVMTITSTDEVCRDLQWLLQRYPLEMTDTDHRYLKYHAAEYDKHVAQFEGIVSGAISPRKFDLALPLREYQRIAADLALRTKGLLIADDVGIGKTVMGIAMLCDPETRPALIVTLTHLPLQWQREFKKFAPRLVTHIIKKGRPYAVDKPPGRRDFLKPKRQYPDVLISNYHKLSGWAEALAGKIKTVIFDECHELRRTDSDKARAAREIAQQAQWRVGLSVGPKSMVELCGGPFGSGWTGPIEEAYDIVEKLVQTEHLLGYDVLRVVHLAVRSRGLVGDRFGWKTVKSLIRHGCDKATIEIWAGGRKLIVTEDHSLYIARDKKLLSVRGDDIVSHDILISDDGHAWNQDGVEEQPFDVIAAIRDITKSQVTVDLGGLNRRQFGVTAWQWENFHKEGAYGTRLPIGLYLQHRASLPPPTRAYVGGGRAPSAPPLVYLSEWAYVLGFFIGDGWVEGKCRVAFAVDNEHVDRLVKELETLPLMLRVKKQPTPSKCAVELRCTHKTFAAILEKVGMTKRCFDKSIPSEWICSWPNTARRRLLEGLMDSDGHKATKGKRGRRDCYATTSQRLAHDVHVLVRSLGGMAGVYSHGPGRGGCINGRVIEGKHTSYSVQWSPYELEGTGYGRCGNVRSLSWSKGWFNEAPLRSFRPVSRPTFVYDMEVNGHPSFVASGLLVHNSATPILNYGNEFFNVIDVLRPGQLGTEDEFLREWCYGSRIGDKARISDPKSFGTYLREQGIMLRRTRKDVARELPDIVKIPHHIDCNMKVLNEAEDATSELARIILAQDTAWDKRGQATREFDMRLRQATGIGKAPHAADFIRLLVENEEKVVVFAWHRTVYDILLERLKQYNPVMYTGSESPAQKDESRRVFIEGESQVLLMSLRAGAGLDGLQESCHTVVFAELDWSPGIHEQAAGRIHRDGQTEPVMCYYLISDEGSDPIVSDVLGIKREQIEGVRNPDADLVEKLTIDDDHIKRLAEAYLEKTRAKKAVAVVAGGGDGEDPDADDAAEPDDEQDQGGLPDNVIPLRPLTPTTKDEK